MRFTVTGEWKRNTLLRLIIVAFLVYGAALWLTNALLYFANTTSAPRCASPSPGATRGSSR